ncbi:MAG: sigma-54 dependent transcriptional regulator, partial [Tannerellaceae bacterium]|nr:sigma-54 dependent transcriptional regulator [Tannerellaceae bacterium]
MERKILIVEDDLAFGTLLKKWFETNGYICVLVNKAGKAKPEILEGNFDLVMTDLRLPDGDGILLLTWIKEQKRNIPVIVMTSYGEVQSAVAAMKIGAYDYLEKPINPSVLKQKIEQVFTALPETQSSVPVVTENTDTKKGFVYGESAVTKELYEHIRMVAPTNMTVLITGESGTGKEYAARMIHENSRRKDAPFFAVDCGSLSRELAPSELFGHLKGSFTSAIANKKGVFELANGGTVFLDEVGNLPYDVQIQLLRTLQEFTIRPVGAANSIKVDVRLIVATNENLQSAIEQGRFREDLYYRLNEFAIEVPPLRKRKEDTLLYATYFLECANKELGKKIKGFSGGVISLFNQYRWSGNLRELRNIVRRAVLFASADTILPEHLPSFLTEEKKETELSEYDGNEEKKIRAALKMTQDNKAAAARLLKIDRKTLY